MECGNRLRVGVRAKNASVSGFACRPLLRLSVKHFMVLFPQIVSYLSVCQSSLPFLKVPTHCTPTSVAVQTTGRTANAFKGVHTPIFLIPKSIKVLLRDICMYCSTQNYYRQAFILRAISSQRALLRDILMPRGKKWLPTVSRFNFWLSRTLAQIASLNASHIASPPQ